VKCDIAVVQVMLISAYIVQNWNKQWGTSAHRICLISEVGHVVASIFWRPSGVCSSSFLVSNFRVNRMKNIKHVI